MRNALPLAFVLVVAVSPVVAQVAAAPDPCAAGARPRFDVVSVRPSQSDSRSSSSRGTADGVLITSSLRRMILSAYSLHDFQLSGGPDWVSTSTWVVDAKNDAPDPDYSKLSREEQKVLQDKRNQAIQSLLADRFQLKCHMTTKELPIYELVVAKGGSKLKETTADQSKDNSISINGRNRQMQATATAITSERMAALLGNEVDRMVVDKSGLKGSYDLTLDWVRDEGAAQSEGPPGPTLFTALEEQLGLKLVPAKGPVSVLVIDAVEMPSEN